MATAWTPPPGYRPSYETCPEVSIYCPVKATTIGYAPNLGVNAFVAAAFGIAAILTTFFGVWKRTWGYSIAVAAGCILECAGACWNSLFVDIKVPPNACLANPGA